MNNKEKIIEPKIAIDFFLNKLNHFNKETITNISSRKNKNQLMNQVLYNELIDKVHKKAIELDEIKNLMAVKIKKNSTKYLNVCKKLEYKKKNFIISDQEYAFKKNKIDDFYKIRINNLKNKYKFKTLKLVKNFKEYQKNIRDKSLLLIEESKKQELNYNNKINLKINQLNKKNAATLITYEKYFKNTNNFFNQLSSEINTNYQNYDDELGKEVKASKLGIDIYEKKISKYKIKSQKKFNHALKTHEILKSPFVLRQAQINSQITKFGDYSSFKQVDKKLFKALNSNKLIIAIIIFSLIVGFINPTFFSSENWLNNILGNNVYFGLLSIGMTFVILVGGIDLSVGTGLALSGSLMLLLFHAGLPIYVAILIGIAAAILISLLMGVIVSYGKFQAFIVTLVGLLVLGGINRIILDGSPISIDNNFINGIGSSINGIFPVALLIFIFVFLIAFIVLKWTKYGRKIYATGSNIDAARVSGINVKWIVASTFLVSGLTVGLGGLIFVSQIKSVAPTTGSGFELDAIAAVVLGGTSLSGGKGSILKTMVGWLVISMLGNIFVFLDLDSNVQLVAKGAIILIAIFLDKDFGIYKKIAAFSKYLSYQVKIL